MMSRLMRPSWKLIFATLLVLSLAVGPLASAGASDPRSGDGAYSPDQILVSFKPGTAAWDRAGAHASLGTKAKGRIPQIDVEIVDVPKDRSVEGLVKMYEKNPNVVFAEPDYVWELEMTPNESLFWRQSHSVDIGLPEAWDVTQGSPNVTIAILDSGIDTTHPDLQRLVPGYDFGEGDSDPTDVNGHGTAVAGIAAQTGNNGIGYAGANWVSPIMPVKVGASDGTVPSSAVAAALPFAADRGARVANMSFSGATYSSAVKSAVDYALAKGMFLCASTGNTGSEGVRYPAGYPGVVGVGSMSSTSVSSFSSYGSHVDLVAPGQGVYTTCLPKNSPYGDRYFFFSGTSASTPYVAGLASLVLSVNPALNGTQVAEILRSTATDFGAAGWDKYYGWGRIDAAAAIRAVAPVDAPSPAPAAPAAPDPVTEEPVTEPEPEPAAATDPVPAPEQPADSIAPSVSITSPAQNSVVSGLVTIRAEAGDENAVARVQFFVNGVLLGRSQSPPYTMNWNTKKYSGEQALTAVAYDAAGNTGLSEPITVTVGTAEKNAPPKKK